MDPGPPVASGRGRQVRLDGLPPEVIGPRVVTKRVGIPVAAVPPGPPIAITTPPSVAAATAAALQAAQVRGLPPPVPAAAVRGAAPGAHPIRIPVPVPIDVTAKPAAPPVPVVAVRRPPRAQSVIDVQNNIICAIL